MPNSSNCTTFSILYCLPKSPTKKKLPWVKKNPAINKKREVKLHQERIKNTSL